MTSCKRQTNGESGISRQKEEERELPSGIFPAFRQPPELSDPFASVTYFLRHASSTRLRADPRRLCSRRACAGSCAVSLRRTSRPRRGLPPARTPALAHVSDMSWTGRGALRGGSVSSKHISWTTFTFRPNSFREHTLLRRFVDNIFYLLGGLDWITGLILFAGSRADLAPSSALGEPWPWRPPSFLSAHGQT